MSSNLIFDIIANDKASKVIQQVGDTVSGEGSKWGNWQKAGTIATAAVGVGVVKFGIDSVGAYTEAEASHDQLVQAYAKFPALADVQIDKLDNLNTALQRKTGFDNDATAAAQATLATFGLTGAQISQLTPLMQDYAAKTGTDIGSAAEAMGKAVLGQGRALKAVGVDFSDTGDAAGNFDQLVGGLTDKVGGFAEAAGGTAAGQAKILAVSMEDLQEQAGETLMPALSGLTTVGIGALQWMTDNATATKVLVGVLGTMVAVVAVASNWEAIFTTAKTIGTAAQWAWNTATGIGSSTAVTAIGVKALEVGSWVASTAAKIASTAATVASSAATGIATAAQWAWNAALNANPIGLVILAVVALVAAFVWLWNNCDGFRNFFLGMWEGIKTAAAAVGDWFTGTFMPALGAVWDAIKAGAQFMWDLLLTIFSWSPLGIVINNWDAIAGAFSGAFQKIKDWASSAWQWIVDKFEKYTPLGMIISNWDAIIGFFSGLPSKLGTAISGIWDGLWSSFKGALNNIIRAWNDFTLTIGGGTIAGVTLPSVTLNTPNLPMLASGGRILSGGMAIVGERGPEPVFLPTGSEVVPNGGAATMRLHPDDLAALAGLLADHAVEVSTRTTQAGLAVRSTTRRR